MNAHTDKGHLDLTRRGFVKSTAGLIFSFALRGAGDTRFVTVVCLTLAWPMMVIPTWAVYHFQWGLNWAWVSATGYIITQAIVFLLRFRQGRWRSMRVIEPSVVEGVDPTRIVASTTERVVKMYNLLPKFHVVLTRGSIECRNEPGYNWAQKMIPRDCLYPIFLELFEAT